MEILIIGGLIALAPLLLALFMRANAGAMFLAGCGGIVLLTTLDPVLITTAGSAFPSEGEALVRLLVIAAAIIYTAVMFKNSVRGFKAVANILAAALLGVLLLVQLPSLTGLSVLVDMVSEDWWRQLQLYDSAIVVFGLILSLLMVLSRSTGKNKHKSKH